LNRPLVRKYMPCPSNSPTNRLHGNHEFLACMAHCHR
jgi:hypothetical protein